MAELQIDDTNSKHLQEELEALSQLPEANPVPFLRLSHDGALLYSNPAFRRLAKRIGISEEELGPIMPGNYLKLLRQVIDENQTLVDVKVEIRDCALLLTFCPLKSKRQVFVTIVDVTEHQKQCDQLKVYAQQLELAYGELGRAQVHLVRSQKMASLGMLSAGIAHEINTPLGAISSNQQTLRSISQKLQNLTQEFVSFSSPESREDFAATLQLMGELLRASRAGCDRIANIVKSLAAFAGLDEAEENVVDIHRGLECTLTLLYNQLKRRIRVERHYGKLSPIECYPNRLNQVFLNLLVNAIQAIPGAGTIRIETWDEEGWIEIRISDTGIGIPPENLGRIFDPGFTTKGLGVGAGLGLSICYQILQEHGGKIDVQSTPGEGSAFTIQLPKMLPKQPRATS